MSKIYFFLGSRKRCINQLTIVSTMLNPIAHQILSTSKCGRSSQEHNMTIRPLMTKVNSPSVRKLMGNANSLTSGLMQELMKPRTTATSTAHQRPGLYKFPLVYGNAIKGVGRNQNG